MRHVNIGATQPKRLRWSPLPLFRATRQTSSVRTSRAGRDPTSTSKESPTSSVSDAIIDFFDDITRGSVSSMDETDESLTSLRSAAAVAAADTAAVAAEAADTAAAAAAAASRAAAGAGRTTAAVGDLEDAVAAALAVASASASVMSSMDMDAGAASSTTSKRSAAAPASSDAGGALAATKTSAAENTRAAAASGGAGDTLSAAAQSLEAVAAVTAQDLSTSGPDSKLPPQPSSSSDSSSGSSGSSRQAVTQETVAAAGGAVQASTLALTASPAEEGAVAAGAVAAWLVKGVVGVGLLQAYKAAVESALLQAGLVAVPGALVSMLSVPLLLSVLGQKTAQQLVALFDDCVAPWTTDLLGLFYVPAVAILPVLLRGMQGSDLLGLLGVTAASAALTLLLTAAAAAAWTKSPTPGAAATPGDAPSPRLTSGPAAPVLLSLSFLAAAGPLALTRFDPQGFGAAMALPVGFAWSLLGFFAARVGLNQQRGGDAAGTQADSAPGWLSPVLVGALAANVGVAWHGHLMGWSYLSALSRYYAADVLGAGDVLCAPLGAALTGLGFLIYKHRAALAPAAVAATSLLSAAISVATAVAAARLLGVSSDWARAFIPRSVTADAASRFAGAVGAPPECAGLVVLLQAAVTVALGGACMRLVFGQKQRPAVSGAAAGATAGVVGAVGVCGTNEVALASGALAYACMVVGASAASSIPAVMASLVSLVA